MSKNPKTDYAYIAGIIDGEGCISIVRSARSKRPSPEYYLKVVVCINSVRVANKLVGVFGGHVYMRKRQIGRHLQHVWYLNGRNACEMLKKVRPYLTEKREQADLGIHFDNYLARYNHKFPTQKITPEHNAKRDKAYWRMRKLKKEFLVPNDDFLPSAVAETKWNSTRIGEAIVHPN